MRRKAARSAFLTLCDMSQAQRSAAEEQIRALSSEGLRVIAVASANPMDEESVPASITDCHLCLLGLVALADPPRESVKNDIAICKRAGIRVVMITGDSGVTASAIAKKVGMGGR